jgi:UDP:flavonoid glycosyltransferase YjiC (YdhE family)
MRRAMFFPWSAGGAAGYTGRCLAVAERVKARYRCSFGPETRRSLAEEAGFAVVGWKAARKATFPRRDYLPFANLERVYAVAGRYYRADRVWEHVVRDRVALEEQRPDLVVIDMQPTAAIAARSMGLPVLSIADADFLSPSPVAWMPWLTLDPDALMPYPSCLPAFNEALEKMSLTPIQSPTELLWGDVTIVPSCQELEPVPEPAAANREAIHVGPLYWDPPKAAPQPPSASSGCARVYVTIGSGGMASGQLFQRVLDALAQPCMVVFASAGINPPPGTRKPFNAHVGGFTGLTRLIRWSDLVVTHGGYSSVIATIAQARPQIVLPLMSEQEANGRDMVERTGCGVLIRKTRVDEQARKLFFVNCATGETRNPIPECEDILAAVSDVLKDGRRRERAEEMSANLACASRSADLLALFDLAQA